MKAIRYLFLFSVSIFLFSSCSFQKRHYLKGYYISKNHNSVKKQDRSEEKGPLEASLGASPMERSKLMFSDYLFSLGNTRDSLKAKGCDTIHFKSGEKVSAVVSEISGTEVKYKKCNNPNGPTFVHAASEIAKIKYSNGTEEVINGVAVTPKADPNSNLAPAKPIYDKETKAEMKKKALDPNRRRLNIYGLLSACFAVLSTGASQSNLLGGLAMSIAAIVLSIIALRQMKKEPTRYKGKWLAVVGLILGCVDLLIIILVIVALTALA